MPGTVSDSSNDSIGFFLSKISKKKVSVFFLTEVFDCLIKNESLKLLLNTEVYA